jgi:predicted  nucleic acid-binding Zn-ribbon protein
MPSKNDLQITPENTDQIIAESKQAIEELKGTGQMHTKKIASLEMTISNLEQSKILFQKLLESERLIKETNSNIEKKQLSLRDRESKVAAQEKELETWRSSLIQSQTEIRASMDKHAFELADRIVSKKSWGFNRNKESILEDILTLVPVIKNKLFNVNI